MWCLWGQIENRLFLDKMDFDNFNLNFFNIIIISGVLHGVIFSAVVYKQRKKISKSIVYLGYTVLFLSLSNLQYWLIDTNVIVSYTYLKSIFIPWQWLIMPMFFLYVYKFVTRKKISQKINLLLFSPFFVILLLYLSQALYSFFIKEYIIPSHFEKGFFVYIEFLSFIFNIMVLFFCHKTIVDYEHDNDFNLAHIKPQTKWLKKLIITGLVICVFWLVALIIIVSYDLNQSYLFYPMWITISILVYWIGYVGISKSKQLEEIQKLREKRILNLIKKKAKTLEYNLPKAFQKIEHEIITNKEYLNPNINLDTLSKTLNLSEGYISQQININSGMNFNDFINNYRVNNAKQILEDSDYDNYTIVSIGLESGFNSKSSFYTAFKKFTNKTPTQYKKDVRNL